MFTKSTKWVSLAVLLLLALLWPSPGYQTLLAFAFVAVGVILAIQANRAGKYFWEAGYAMVSRKVKYED